MAILVLQLWVVEEGSLYNWCKSAEKDTQTHGYFIYVNSLTVESGQAEYKELSRP